MVPVDGTWLLIEDDCIGQAVGHGGFVYNHINLYDMPSQLVKDRIQFC
jgi:hypothetical protein